MAAEKNCPHCGRENVSGLQMTKKKFLENGKLVANLQKGAQQNPYMSGVLSAIFAADFLGLVQLHICPTCHKPFL